MSAQVAADLRAAAEVLRRDGWTQAAYHRVVAGRICHCAEGAIAVATGDHTDICVTDDGEADWRMGDPYGEASIRRDAADDALAKQVGDPQRVTVPGWNDDEGRTADEVIAALLAAADAAEAAQ